MANSAAKITLYKTAKLFHITGLVLWLGPSAGGYILFMLARYDHRPAEALWILGGYITLVDLEAAGLVLLIISGLVMRGTDALLKRALWLKRKHRIVFLVFLPLEAANLYICHSVLERALIAGTGVGEAIAIYDKFTVISVILLGVAIPVVLWLAIFKPWSMEDGESKLDML